MKKLILTVCWGNIQRSVFAQLCLTRELAKRGLEKEFFVLSCGIQGSCGTTPTMHHNLMGYEKDWVQSKPWLEKIGIEIPETQISTPISRDIVDKATIILAMERKIMQDKDAGLLVQFPDVALKMMLFTELVGRTDDIPDCDGKEDNSLYERVILGIDMISRQGIDRLIELTRF